MIELNRKPIFDAFRKVLGRGFKDSEIDLIDDAFEEALGIEDDIEEEDANSFYAAATKHLRAEEGVRYKAYKDHLGYWTNGVGRLIDPRRSGRYTKSLFHNSR